MDGLIGRTLERINSVPKQTALLLQAVTRYV